MSLFDIDDEQTLRAEIVAYLETFPVLGKIFDRRRMISSLADFVDKLSIEVAGDVTEVRYVEIELIDIEDSPDEGFDDCPIGILTYNLHFFAQFADERSDGSNSDKDFTDGLLQLRNGFLNKRTWVSGSAESEPLESAEFSQFGQDTLTDCKGYTKDLTLKVFYKYD